MDVRIPEAKDRDGKPAAQPTPPAPRRVVRFDTMRGRIQMKPGWDRPLTVNEFLSGDFGK